MSGRAVCDLFCTNSRDKLMIFASKQLHKMSNMLYTYVLIRVPADLGCHARIEDDVIDTGPTRLGTFRLNATLISIEFPLKFYTGRE